MRVGLRLGLCVRDIMLGKVAIDDVLVIVLSSKFNPNQAGVMTALWKIYERQEWNTGHSPEQYQELVMKLYKQGKLHQPKIYGGAGHSMKTAWLNLVELDEPEEFTGFNILGNIDTRVSDFADNEITKPSALEIAKIERRKTAPAPLNPAKPYKIDLTPPAVPGPMDPVALTGLEVTESQDFSAFEIALDLDLTKPK